MDWTKRDEFHVSPGYQPLLREAGLDAEGVFTHSDIEVWRSIPERENGVLDVIREDGSRTRVHVKRYHATGQRVTPAKQEAEGIRLLQDAGIATVPLVGWGEMADGRSFILSEDLAGYEPADKAVARGVSFDQLLIPLARMAGRLHQANLHHRDLYLCHFFVNEELDVRLIDAGRVKKLPGWPFRRRWVVKDLAQVAHSMAEAGVAADRFEEFLREYGASDLLGAVRAKAGRIGRHDRRLRERQPTRNVSIPK